MILGCINPYVNIFVRATNCLIANPIEEVHICITTSCTPENGNVRHYNVPTTNEVAMIILGKSEEVAMSLYNNDMEVVYNR
jgi:hypothetical protein